MTYVMSDLHGRMDLYLRMLELLEFSPADSLYLLGDLTDRNRGGIALFRDVMARPNVQMLLGNHEHMLFHALTDPEGISLNGHESNRELWYRNGGRVTQEEFEEQPETVRRAILDYIERLPLNRELELGGRRFLLCHASPVCMFRTYGIFYANEREFAVWSRIEPWMKVRFDADVMLCGHTPTGYYSRDGRPMEICRLRENVYDVDCGCAGGEERGGRLGCLRLEDFQTFYVSAPVTAP